VIAIVVASRKRSLIVSSSRKARTPTNSIDLTMAGSNLGIGRSTAPPWRAGLASGFEPALDSALADTARRREWLKEDPEEQQTSRAGRPVSLCVRVP
jgi:hypothetical protein